MGFIDPLVWFALELAWLLLAVLAGNQMGHFPYLKFPISKVCIGPNKTWGAYIAGPLYSGTVVALLWDIAPMLTARFGITTIADAFAAGGVIGLGVVCGDQANSLQKRARGKPAGYSSKFDRFDWAFGGGVFACAWLYPHVEPQHVAALVDIAIPAHVYFNRNSYHRGWRKTEH